MYRICFTATRDRRQRQRGGALPLPIGALYTFILLVPLYNLCDCELQRLSRVLSRQPPKQPPSQVRRPSTNQTGFLHLHHNLEAIKCRPCAAQVPRNINLKLGIRSIAHELHKRTEFPRSPFVFRREDNRHNGSAPCSTHRGPAKDNQTTSPLARSGLGCSANHLPVPATSENGSARGPKWECVPRGARWRSFLLLASPRRL